MGLNLSHQQISQSLLFLAQDRHREKLVFFLFFLLKQSIKGKHSSLPNRQILPHGANGLLLLMSAAPCMLSSESGNALLLELHPWPGCFQQGYSVYQASLIRRWCISDSVLFTPLCFWYIARCWKGKRKSQQGRQLWTDISRPEIEEFPGLLEDGLKEEGREGAAKGAPGHGAQALQGQGRWRLALAPGANSWPWTLLLGEENTCAACNCQIIPLLPREQQWRADFSCRLSLMQTAPCSSGRGVGKVFQGLPGTDPQLPRGLVSPSASSLLVSLWDNPFQDAKLAVPLS